MYIYTCLYIYSYIYTAQEWKHHTPNATNGSIHRFWSGLPRITVRVDSG